MLIVFILLNDSAASHENIYSVGNDRVNILQG